jgi:hypothetical protein
MANKLIEEPLLETRKRKQYRIKLPKIEGKFGFSLYIGNKEIFIGLAVADVVTEQVVRKRLVKAPKSGIKVIRFDPQA